MGIFNRFFKEKEIAEEPREIETAWYSDTFFGARGGKFESYNPDALVQKKGHDIYKKMLRDPQVKSAYNLLIDIIIAKGIRFKVDGEDPEQEKIKDFFQDNIKRMKGTFKQSMKNILMCKAQGYSVSEKVYEVKLFEGQDKWYIHAIKPKQYNSFFFEEDEFGNVEKLEQEQDTGRKKLDRRKFVIMVNHPEIDLIYGESDLRACYRPYWEKDNITKFWNIYLERIAGGFIVATPEPGAPILSKGEKDQFDTAIKNMSKSTGIRTPAGYKIEVISGTSTEAFEKAIAVKNKEIAKALLVPNLLGFSEQGNVGSNAQAEVQQNTFFFIVDQQADLLADVLNEQIFRELAWWNFGTTDFPQFEFENFTIQQKREIAKAWTEALKDGAVVNTFEDELRTRELLGYDEREDIKNEDGVDVDKALPGGEPKKVPTQEADERDPEKTKTVEATSHKKSFAEEPEYERRVDFIQIEQLYDNAERSFFDDLAPAVDAAFADVLEMTTVTYNRLSEDKEDIEPTIEVAKLDNAVTPKNKATLNQVLRKHQRSFYEEGREQAQNEIEIAVKDADKDFKERIILASKLTKRRAIKLTRGDEENHKWTVADFVDGLRPDVAEKFFASKSFWITGVITQDMEDAAQLVILNGIKNEFSVREVEDELKNVVSPLIGTFDPETGKINKEERARLNTIVRTNLSDAFNQAQLSVFTDPELGDFVKAYQYSAILDKRTSAFCRTYQGRVFLKNDPVWSSITPPNHFNALAEDTFITTDKGLKKIKNIRPGDRVKTHTGKYKKVYDVMAKTPDTKLFKKLKLSSGRVLQITDEHPVLTRRGWKYAIDLKVGDILFQDSKQFSRVMKNVVLPNPDDFPFVLNEIGSVYDVSFSSGRDIMTFPVKLNDNSIMDKGEINDKMINTKLGAVGETEHIKPMNKSLFSFTRVISKIAGKFNVSFFKNINVFNRVLLFHSFRMSFHNVRGFFRKAVRPMVGPSRFVKLVCNFNLFNSSPYFDAMSFTPTRQSGFTNSKAALNGSDRLFSNPMPFVNEFFNNTFVSKIHNTTKNKINNWKPVTIVSIEDIECNSNLWNLAVEDDETYIAEGIIVHNCRSRLIAVTEFDTFVTSPKVTSVRPDKGFGETTL